MIDVVRYIAFLKKHELNQAQFMLMYLMYYERYDLLQEYKDMFPTEDNSAIGKGGLSDLINRGFIIDLNPKDDKARSLKLTDKFSYIFVDKYVMSEELWEAYPTHVIRGSVRYSLTLTDEDELREKYYQKIKGLKDEHVEVMKDLKFAVENQLIVGTIKNFVGSKQWLAFRKERQGDTGNNQVKKREVLND